MQEPAKKECSHYLHKPLPWHPAFERDHPMHAVLRPLLLATVLLLGLSACQSSSQNAAAVTLENNYWKLVELNGKTVAVIDNQSEPHLILQSEAHRVAGSGGCNRIMGSYAIKGSTVFFQQMASTMMFCAEGMEAERVFLQTLEGEKRWATDSDSLTLTDKQGVIVARFKVVYLR